MEQHGFVIYEMSWDFVSRHLTLNGIKICVCFLFSSSLLEISMGSPYKKQMMHLYFICLIIKGVLIHILKSFREVFSYITLIETMLCEEK